MFVTEKMVYDFGKFMLRFNLPLRWKVWLILRLWHLRDWEQKKLRPCLRWWEMFFRQPWVWKKFYLIDKFFETFGKQVTYDLEDGCLFYHYKCLGFDWCFSGHPERVWAWLHDPRDHELVFLLLHNGS